MLLATLIFTGWNYIWLVVPALVLAVVLLFWSYRTAPSSPIRWLCPLLKTAGLVALALCLLEPLWSGQRAKPGANFFAVVADNSQGLQIHDHGALRSRGDMLRDLLVAHGGDWQQALDDNFEVRRYLFDARLQGTKDFSELDFNGRSTRIGAALKSHMTRKKAAAKTSRGKAVSKKKAG